MRWTIISGVLVTMIAGVAIPATRPSQTEMLDKLLKIEDQRLVGDADLDLALNSTDSLVVKTALRIVARFGEQRYANAVRHALQSNEMVVRKEAAFAAGMMRDKAMLGDLTATLAMEEQADVKAELLLAIGRMANRDALTALEMVWGKENSVSVHTSLARAFGYVFENPESSQWPITEQSLKALWMATQSIDANLARNAAYALSRYRPEGQLLETWVHHQLNLIVHADAKAIAVRLLGKFPTEVNAKWIASQIVNPVESDNIRIELVRALGRLPANVGRDQGVCFAVKQASPTLVVAALEVAEASVTEALARCRRDIESIAQRSLSYWVKGQALGTLMALDKAQSYAWFESAAASANPWLEKAVFSRIGKVEDPRIRLATLKALQEKERTVIVSMLESIQEFPENWLGSDFKAVFQKLLLRQDFVLTSLIYDLAAKFKWQEFLLPALETLKFDWKEDEYDALMGALRLLGQIGGMQHLIAIEPLLNHSNRFVIEAAVAAHQAISGAAPREVPLNHPNVRTETPSYNEAIDASKRYIVIETKVGVIKLEAYGEALLTYRQFSNLAKQGFFNGRDFHRVVPHFVAQGGDPRGDGWGGPGFLIRDEVSPVSHTRGTVGLASSGKDTGGCQLFFNLDPNLSLDGKYTLFARVVSGLEVMDRIEVGTKIISAYVQ